jgi:5-methyltetrahydrofolate--homocysteine methyltransferase
MNAFDRILQSGGVLLLDGAWGTEFFQRGLMPGSPPDEWNLTHPEIVQEITRDYLSAGARVILTNTFGANRFRLEPHGLSGRVREINRKAAALAREVVGAQTFLAGDIGPTARFLALGEVSAEELRLVFAEQAQALAEGGVDLIVVESMTDAEEMAVAVDAAQETNLPVVASVTYNRTPHGYRTMMGNPPDVCVKKAEQAGAAVIGANCGSGIEDYVPLAPILRELTSLPLWIKANAGIPHIVGGKVTYPLTASRPRDDRLRIKDELHALGLPLPVLPVCAPLRELLLGCPQRSAPALMRAQMLGQLIATRISVERVLGSVDFARLLQDLARELLVVEV